MSRRLTLVARSVQNQCNGHVSKAALLTWMLPLSFALLFGTLIAAALSFPAGYEWHRRVISKLTSPHDNPEGCWLPSLGIMLAMLLALPFAGYVAQRLHSITPRLARLAGLAFAFGFVLMFLSMAAQLAQPFIGLRWLHEFLARASAVSFAAGMLSCCACALKDRIHRIGGKRVLPGPLAFYWATLVLLPIGVVAGIGVLLLLGHQAGQTWAEDFRQSFRHTAFWQLAFWEWIGAAVAFAFLIGSALLLPGSCGPGRKEETGPASLPADVSVDSLLPEQGKSL